MAPAFRIPNTEMNCSGTRSMNVKTRSPVWIPRLLSTLANLSVSRFMSPNV